MLLTAKVIDVLVTFAVILVIGKAICGSWAMWLMSRSIFARMDRFSVWMEHQGTRLRHGELTKAERREFEMYALKAVSSRGKWDFRGPWEKR